MHTVATLAVFTHAKMDRAAGVTTDSLLAFLEWPSQVTFLPTYRMNRGKLGYGAERSRIPSW